MLSAPDVGGPGGRRPHATWRPILDASVCLATGDYPDPGICRSCRRRSRTSTVFLLDEFGGAPGRSSRQMRNDAAHDSARSSPGAASSDFPDVDAPDLEMGGRRYRDLINSGGLDLAVLGLGKNGHLGLNEPGSAADQRTRIVQLTEETAGSIELWGGSPHLPGDLAVGLAEILAAREIWLLVTGSNKAEVLTRVVNDTVTDRVPASLLRNHSNSDSWSDRAAAALL